MSSTRPLAVAALAAIGGWSVVVPSSSSVYAAAVTHGVVLAPGAEVAGTGFRLAPFDVVDGIQLNDNGEFVFHIDTDDSYNGIGNRDQGLIRGNLANPAALALVGRTGQTIGGATLAEMNRGVALNNAGSLLWSFDVDPATVPTNNYGDTIVKDGAVIAKYGDTIAGQTFTGSLSESVSLSQGGKVSHFLHLPTPTDADSSFPFNEQLVLVVDGVAKKRGGAGNSTLGGQPFHGFGQSSAVAANDAGKVVVTAWMSGAFDNAIWVLDGATETKLAEDGDAYAGAGPYNGWTTNVGEQFVLNEAGDVAYQLWLTNPENGDDEVTLLLKNGAVIASTWEDQTIGGQSLDGIDDFVMNESGQVAFAYYSGEGEGEGGMGIALDGVPLVYSGLEVDGKTIESLGSAFDLNDNGQLLYTATFTDGSTALLVAAVPEPTGVAVLGVVAVAAMTRRRRR